MERKQVFYINSIKFVCDTVENICKNKELECYTLLSAQDFAYLIDDLRPELVMINTNSLNSNFWDEIDKASLKPKTMLIGEDIDGVSEELKERFDFTYPEKIDVITFGQILKNHLN